MKLIILLCACVFSVLTSHANVYLVTSNANSGAGTLRQAITDANNHAGRDSIKFNLADSSVSGRTIILGSAFPSLSDNVIIDGTSQAHGHDFGISFAKIQITASISITQCFNINADSCEIYGLFITGFQTGIIINNPYVKIGALNHGNVIFNCSTACVTVQNSDHASFVANLIGIDTAQNIAPGIAGDGIQVVNGYAISIGGHGLFSSNVISGNNFGLKFDNSAFCEVTGNYIGTSSNGLTAIPNAYGIRGSGLTNTSISIGGDSVFERNILSGNTHAGIYGSFTSSDVQGNYIGTDATGLNPLGNGDAGIYFTLGSSNNLIGNEAGAQSNVIAFNGLQAIFLQGSACINNSVRRNSTFCNGFGGFTFNGANGNINPPALIIANQNGVTGVTVPNGIIDIFTDDSCNHCEGKTLITSTTAGSNGVYIYNGALSGSITATVTDTAGNTSEYSPCTVTTSTTCIAAQFTLAAAVCTNAPALFLDQTVTQPGTTLITWQWDFGDGGSSASQSPSHLYTSTGSYTVSLIVSNSASCADTITNTITVTGTPTASFSLPSAACVGSQALFEDQSSGGVGAILTGWQWDFGDGGISSLQNPVHEYSTLGTYDVTLTVTNSNLCTDQLITSLTVLAPPQAGFSFSPNNFQVTFTNSSFVYGGASYTWDFGDGVTSNAQNPVHVYGTGGIYTVCLTAYDSLCMTADSICQTVNLPVGIDNLSGSAIIISPNPTGGIIRISGLSSSEIKTICVRDLLGSKLREESIPKGSSGINLNLEHLADGMYFIEMNFTNGVLSRKISVSH